MTELEVCEICNFTVQVHTEEELETCKKVRLLDNLIREIEGGGTKFSIASGTDKEKVIYLTSIERKDGVAFFGEGSTPLEAIEDVLK